MAAAWKFCWLSMDNIHDSQNASKAALAAAGFNEFWVYSLSSFFVGKAEGGLKKQSEPSMATQILGLGCKGPWKTTKPTETSENDLMGWGGVVDLVLNGLKFVALASLGRDS